MSAGQETGDLLFIAHRVPYPPNKGDKIRSFHEIRYLAERGWRIHLCALADDPTDLGHVEALKRSCRTVFLQPISPAVQKLRSLTAPLRGAPLSVPFFYSDTLQRRVDALLDRHPIRTVFCFSGPTAEYVFRSASARLASVGCRVKRGTSPRDAARPRLVMDLIDVDSDKWAQYARWGSGPMSWVYRLESRLLARYERKVAERFDATLLVSPAEAETFRSRTGLDERIHALGNGVDLEYFHPSGRSMPPGADEGARLVFCGAMDYFPNVDAVTWFTRDVLPIVRAEIGPVEFVIVGSNPTEEVLALRDAPGVKVTGRVDDVRPYVWGSDLSVAPIRVARGVQNKVLEAMAMGKGVVATPQAYEGIRAGAGDDLVVATAEPGVFAAAVGDLLRRPARRSELGVRARRVVESHYPWSAQLGTLRGHLAGPPEVRQ